MGHHCCSKQKVKRGLWSPEEDEKLVQYITTHGHGCWSSVPKQAGLQRCGKSCRLRWINYLRPDLKRGSFSAQEERVIIDVHRILGNRWAQIAKHLPGRTDNEVKNFWNSCIKKKLIAQGLDPKTHKLFPASRPSNGAVNPPNPSQFHHPQPPTASFTISSNVKGFEEMAAPPLALSDQAMPISALQYQDHSPLMSFKEPDFMNGAAAMDHPSMPSFTQPEFMEEPCMWAGAGEAMEAPRQDEIPMMQPPHGHGQWQAHPMPNEPKCLDMEGYDSGAFDLELMESALMPCGVFSSGSSMDQFPWD